jgi:hypothetical protein
LPGHDSEQHQNQKNSDLPTALQLPICLRAQAVLAWFMGSRKDAKEAQEFAGKGSNFTFPGLGSKQTEKKSNRRTWRSATKNSPIGVIALFPRLKKFPSGLRVSTFSLTGSFAERS